MKNINELPNQKERIVIVTGANTGLGFETALALAQKEAKVIMACRNLSKANIAKEQIQKKVPNADLEIMQIDLGDLQSVQTFAKNYKEKYNTLDILINNAGVLASSYATTKDGFELQLGANYLAHFLLTGLLIELLLKTPHSRVVTLGSAVHKSGKINFDDLQSEKEFDPMTAYSQSKLANLMFSFELKRRLEKAGAKYPIATAAHPGVAMTQLSRGMPRWIYYLTKYTIAPFLSNSPARGAKSTIWAAIGEAKSGDYFGPQGFREFKGDPGLVQASDLAKDETIAKQLWKVSEELVGIEFLSE